MCNGQEKPPVRDWVAELRSELIRNVTQFIGSAESIQTDISGLTIYRHTTPTAPASVTYEPSVTLVVQGQASRTRQENFPLQRVTVSADVHRSASHKPGSQGK